MRDPRINDLCDALRKHKPVDAVEAAHVAEVLVFLEQNPHPLSRHTSAGHITSSCLAIHPDRPELIVLWHQKIGRWVQPGGHVEDSDASVSDASLRELCEETGAREIDVARRLGVVDVDVHRIPAFKSQPEHIHFDIRYGFVMSEHWVPGETAQWMPASEVVAKFDASMARLGRKVMDFHDGR